MHGRKALENYLDTDTENLDKDSIENLLDQVSEQMPDEESFRYSLNTVWTQITPLKLRKN